MYSKEDVWKARNANLPAFFSNAGYALLKEPRGRYRVVGYGGLILFNCTFCWFSKGLKGNAVDCLMAFFNFSFDRAVEALLGVSSALPSSFAFDASEKQDPFVMPALSKDQHRVFAYLSKTRRIHASLIVYLMKNRLLFQDFRCNCVFPFLDENNVIVGADLIGTLSSVRFKGVLPGSDENYGFNIRLGSPDSLYAFEAPIDLLSYLCLFPDVFTRGNAVFLSLGGLKHAVLETFLKLFPFKGIYMCLDNDKQGVNGKEKGWGGWDFADSLRSSLPFTDCFPPDPFKDWNDVLRNR